MIDFDLVEEQKMLQTMARDFLTVKCPDSLVMETMKTGWAFRNSSGVKWQT